MTAVRETITGVHNPVDVHLTSPLLYPVYPQLNTATRRCEKGRCKNEYCADQWIG